MPDVTRPPADEPSSAHPFARLTPDRVLDALADIGLRGDGRLSALSSYENRVYQVPLEDGPVVVAKFYRPGRWSEAQILEEHAYALELAQAEVPVVAPRVVQQRTLHQGGGFWFSVSPWRGGRLPELDDAEVLEWLGRYLARIHTVGAARPFASRPALDVQAFGWGPRDWLLTQDQLPLDVRSAWEAVSGKALEFIADFPVLAGPDDQNDSQDPPLVRLRLHGDCHPGNILWTPLDRPAEQGPGPHFVDLDDARTGPAVQDLWMLLSGDRPERTRQLSLLLDGYEQFRDFDRRELALIEPLRTLRMIHYSQWLAQRRDDPAFARSFPWFGSSDYWQGQVQALEDQLEALQEDPLWV